jgi:hydroxymethylpyrimidine pyrophosphatase-like HAD family hydrolase
MRKITAILSDYDGTLCPTSSVKRSEGNTAIPEDLGNILWNISEKIPVCIVSSKDFYFLHKRTKFANIVSCILGIETIILKGHNNRRRRQRQPTKTMDYDDDNISRRISDCDYNNNFTCIKDSQLLVDNEVLEVNSIILDSLAKEISSDFKQVNIERKFTTTTNKKILAAITIDWRHLADWKSFKVNSEPLLKKLIKKREQQKISNASPSSSFLYTQTYSTHPFIDVYAVKCDKGRALDSITSKLPPGIITDKARGIMYLGDSENDNPAFKKADVSIGVFSDKRLNPELDCQYTIDFNELPLFLGQLYDKEFVFSARTLDKK